MPPRLKVYRTQIGFYDAVVAAPNQKAARAAWDVREDLFASDAAGVTDEPAAVEAALARPGVVLRRAVGTTGPFTAEAGPPPDLPAAPKPKRTARPKPPPKASRPPSAPPPKLDRAPLEAAERALTAVEREAGEARAAIAAEREALDRREKALLAELAARRTRAEADLKRAEAAYRLAGGTGTAPP